MKPEKIFAYLLFPYKPRILTVVLSRADGFMLFLRVLAQRKIQIILSRIWTCFIGSIFYVDTVLLHAVYMYVCMYVWVSFCDSLCICRIASGKISSYLSICTWKCNCHASIEQKHFGVSFSSKTAAMCNEKQENAMEPWILLFNMRKGWEGAEFSATKHE